ncbi:hypothetical protein L7F22_056541 [Adiantum nelumboides]|nr:hypothetical protein [Adiantum nelumboides]
MAYCLVQLSSPAASRSCQQANHTLSSPRVNAAQPKTVRFNGTVASKRCMPSLLVEARGSPSLNEVGHLLSEAPSMHQVKLDHENNEEEHFWRVKVNILSVQSNEKLVVLGFGMVSFELATTTMYCIDISLMSFSSKLCRWIKKTGPFKKIEDV